MSSNVPTRVFIALGANLGDREVNLRAAIEKLSHTPGVTITRVSTFFENPAVGGPADSPPFLNAAAEVHTTFSPRALLDRLLEVERELGRVRDAKWSPRTIDLDILLFGDQIITEHGLTIPHPLMHERDFVLVPLLEIAPDFVHPIFQKRIEQLLRQHPGSPQWSA